MPTSVALKGVPAAEEPDPHSEQLREASVRVKTGGTAGTSGEDSNVIMKMNVTTIYVLTSLVPRLLLPKLVGARPGLQAGLLW